MKIVIVSDIHANLAAIEALQETSYDQLGCLGDIVSYGARRHETIRWVVTHARAGVRGNHDHAVDFAVTPECSASYRGLAAATRQYTQEVCTTPDFEFLRELPLRKEMVIDQTRFQLVLKEYKYPIDKTIADICLMPIPERDRQTLISILINGQLVTPRSVAEILLTR